MEARDALKHLTMHRTTHHKDLSSPKCQLCEQTLLYIKNLIWGWQLCVFHSGYMKMSWRCEAREPSSALLTSLEALTISPSSHKLVILNPYSIWVSQIAQKLTKAPCYGHKCHNSQEGVRRITAIKLPNWVYSSAQLCWKTATCDKQDSLKYT